MDLEQITASVGGRRRYAHGATEVREVRRAPTRTNGLCVTRASVAGRQTHIRAGRQSASRWRARKVGVLLRCVLHMSERLGHEGGCSWVRARAGDAQRGHVAGVVQGVRAIKKCAGRSRGQETRLVRVWSGSAPARAQV